MNQNFVPVIDDKKIFIGIIRRKDIIAYCDRLSKSRKTEWNNYLTLTVQLDKGKNSYRILINHYE